MIREYVTSKEYKVKAVQITDSTFDDPHPNADHVVGVIYDPLERRAIIKETDETVELSAYVGDWLVQNEWGEFSVYTDEEFHAYFGPPQGA